MYYDSTSDAWYTYLDNSIKKRVQAGTITTQFTVPSVASIRSLALNRKNEFLIIYYCGSISSKFRLKKWEEETNTKQHLHGQVIQLNVLQNTKAHKP